MEDPILITGCARSGTSMTAGVIHLCGAFGGQMSGPTPNNPRGMFENRTIRQTIVKGYLHKLEVDPLGQYPLPNRSRLLEYPGFGRLIRNVMVNEGYESGPWFYKCAKACLIWPTFHAAFPNAKWIIVRRPTEDIVASCLRTPFMRKRESADSWRRWVEHHIRCFEEMHDAGLNAVEIWPPKDLPDAVAFAGLEWNEKAVSEFVDPSLYRGAA